jgi:hypothetical protein
MKKLLVILLTLSCSNLFAADVPKIKIKEIKAYLETINPDTTCMDEYLHRRKQLIVKLAVSPVLFVGSTVASTYVGGVTAAAIAGAAGAEGWGTLGYAIGGAAVGLASSGAVVAADTTATALVLANMTTIVKTLAEQHMNREEVRTPVLYKKYVKRSKSTITQDEFVAKLMAADASGSLCDGSMVKQPKIRIGTKLQFKVAKLKDVVREL